MHEWMCVASCWSTHVLPVPILIGHDILAKDNEQILGAVDYNSCVIDTVFFMILVRILWHCTCGVILRKFNADVTPPPFIFILDVVCINKQLPISRSGRDYLKKAALLQLQVHIYTAQGSSFAHMNAPWFWTRPCACTKMGTPSWSHDKGQVKLQTHILVAFLQLKWAPWLSFRWLHKPNIRALCSAALLP